MAFGPICEKDGKPKLFIGETILHCINEGIGSVKLNNGVKTRFWGKLYLTNARFVFINLDLTQKLFNFAIHLNLVSGELYVKLAQGYRIEGKFERFLECMQCGGKFKFELKGEVGVMVKHVQKLILGIRKEPPRVLAAFVSPNDPDQLIIVNNRS